MPHNLTTEDLTAAAWALRQCHDETGITLDNWTPVRCLVEALTGPLYDEQTDNTTTPRDYTISLPVTVRVYPDGGIVFLVHPEDAPAGLAAKDAPEAAADALTVTAALDARAATGLVDRRP